MKVDVSKVTMKELERIVSVLNMPSVYLYNLAGRTVMAEELEIVDDYESYPIGIGSRPAGKIAVRAFRG